MCSLFLVLRTLSTTAVRFIKKKTPQRLLLWRVSLMQQRPLRVMQFCLFRAFHDHGLDTATDLRVS